MISIAVMNQKGGVGKTTSTVNIGAGLSLNNKRVLLIDLDPQAHLTTSLGIDPDRTKHNTTFNYLTRLNLSLPYVVDRQMFDVIPSERSLIALHDKVRTDILRTNIKGIINRYDFVLIDCPPGLDNLTLNALDTAKSIFVIMQPDYLSFKGLQNLMEYLRELNIKELGGVIFNGYDNRKNLNKEVVSNIKKIFGKAVFNTYIRSNVSLAEAPAQSKTIFEYRSGSNGAQDYMNLTKEILKRFNK